MAVTTYYEFRPDTIHVINADFGARLEEVGAIQADQIIWTATGEVEVLSVADYLTTARSVVTVRGGSGPAELVATVVFDSGITDFATFDFLFIAVPDEIRELIGSFRREFPEFQNGVNWPDRVVSKAIEEALAETGGSRWGTARQRAVRYFAAHLLASAWPDGFHPDRANAAPLKTVASKSVSDESISYFGAAATDRQGLQTTRYGQRFLALRSRTGGAVAL